MNEGRARMNYPNMMKTLRCLCLISLLLIGCQRVPPVETSNFNPDEPIVLKLWGGVPREAGPQEVVDLWNSRHPDIQVEYVQYSNDDNGNLRLDTALLNEGEVDLFFNYFSSNYKQRVKMGVVENLSDMNLFDIEDKMGLESKEWEVNGNYYAVPTKKNYYFVLINKDALKEVGLTVPNNWTWNELREYAKQLTTDNRWGFVQYDFVLPYPIDGTLGNEGYVKIDGSSNFDHIVVKNHLRLLHEMMYIDKSTPLLSEQLKTKMPLDMLFFNGQAAILFGGEWVLRYANNGVTGHASNFDIAFAPIPQINHAQRDFQQIGGVGDALSINVHSEYKQEALAFIEWYVDEGMFPMAKGGRLPASKDANMERALSLLTGEHDRFDNESLERIMRGDLPTMHLTLDQEVIDLRKEEFENFFSGGITLSETIDNLVNRHNKFLGRKK